jgi:hypothetical protein
MPVMYRAWSEHRKTTAFETSLGSIRVAGKAFPSIEVASGFS